MMNTSPIHCRSHLVFLFIDQKDWTKLRKKQHRRRFKTLNWTSVMAKGTWSVHPYCSFGFKCRSVKSIGSKRSGPVFTCYGYCIFDDCPVEVKIKFQEESSLKAEVIFSGDLVCHRWGPNKKTAGARWGKGCPVPYPFHQTAEDCLLGEHWEAGWHCCGIWVQGRGDEVATQVTN